VDERLTTGEKVLIVGWIVSVVILPFLGIVLLAVGETMAGGVVLAFALTAFLVPVKRIMRRRLDSRERSAD
jgi:hypothetical protein